MFLHHSTNELLTMVVEPTDIRLRGAMIIVVMGVSGSGKSTIGALLARKQGWDFVDADDFHSPSNKTKMTGGQPLDDADREPWLAALNLVMRSWAAGSQSGILACSTLKQSYRDSITKGLPPSGVRIVWLDGPRGLIAMRLASRNHEFMNAGLLDSQLATLEPPQGALRIFNEREPADVVMEILEKIGIQSGIPSA